MVSKSRQRSIIKARRKELLALKKEGKISRRQFNRLIREAGASFEQSGRLRRPSTEAQVIGKEVDKQKQQQEQKDIVLDPGEKVDVTVNDKQFSGQVVQTPTNNKVIAVRKVSKQEQAINLNRRRLIPNRQDGRRVSTRAVSRSVADRTFDLVGSSSVPEVVGQKPETIRERNKRTEGSLSTPRKIGKGILELGEETIVSPLRGVGKIVFDPFDTGRKPIIDIGQTRFLRVEGGRKNLIFDPDVQAFGTVVALGAIGTTRVGGTILKKVVSPLFVGSEGVRVAKDPSAENVGRLIGAAALVSTPSIISKTRTGVRRVKAQRSFSTLEKSTQTKAPFVLLERTQGPQRDLFGRSVSDVKVQQSLLETNRLKVGFGIERNPLRPSTSSIIPTGQTKLVRDQIIAVDVLSGKTSRVNVRGGQPFVFRENLGTFTEFVPGRERLLTRPGSPRKVNVDVTRIDATTQTQLFPKTVDRSVKPLLEPPQPRRTRSKPVRVFSETGAESISIQRSNTLGNVRFSSTQETFFAQEPRAVTPRSSARSRFTFFNPLDTSKQTQKQSSRPGLVSIPVVSSNSLLDTRPGFDVFPQPRSISVNRSTPIIFEDILPDTRPDVRQRSKPQTKPIADTSPIVSLDPFPGPSPISFKPPKDEDPFLQSQSPSIIDLGFDTQPRKRKKSKKRKKGQRQFRKTRSLVGIAFKIPEIKTPKGFTFSGFEVR